MHLLFLAPFVPRDYQEKIIASELNKAQEFFVTFLILTAGRQLPLPANESDDTHFGLSNCIESLSTTACLFVFL